MQRLVLLYVKSLQDMVNRESVVGGAGPAPGTKSALGTKSAPGTHLQLNEAGFPEVLASFDAHKCSKRELEILMRQYLSHHYRMFVCHLQTGAHYLS